MFEFVAEFGSQPTKLIPNADARRTSAAQHQVRAAVAAEVLLEPREAEVGTQAQEPFETMIVLAKQ